MSMVATDVASDGDDGLPLVGEDDSNRPLWVGLVLIAFLGLLLFVVLESRRQAPVEPSVQLRASDFSAAPLSTPELYVPPAPLLTALSASNILPRSYLPPILSLSTRPRTVLVPTPLTQVVPFTASPPFPLAVAVQPPPKPGGQNDPVIIYDIAATPDAGSALSAQAGTSSPLASAVAPASVRAKPGRVQARTNLISQGTLIPAVLETAIDSTQPGQVRALVASNVLNFAGDRVLIPKGSRLYGEYRGELGEGQKRAQVQWSRLERPDGATIALDSPATDQLGRAGIKGHVNSRFLERFVGALLQTSLDVGTLAASRSLSGTSVIVTTPALQSASSQLVPPVAKPVLRVRQGTRIAVLVARDLDFSSVEQER